MKQKPSLMSPIASLALRVRRSGLKSEGIRLIVSDDENGTLSFDWTCHFRLFCADKRVGSILGVDWSHVSGRETSCKALDSKFIAYRRGFDLIYVSLVQKLWIDSKGLLLKRLKEQWVISR
ncbi:hypothetical protein TNCT_214691 [Trichonephila clavata]|uniref:Uncharacterized protein n=1 Tax=Trichonephila clavata TaxID=2740835 RepID=A0A8X6FHX8_TRICU|nr:hypothetical protein TNCT_214691 [Trichonephila clavata]